MRTEQDMEDAKNNRLNLDNNIIAKVLYYRYDYGYLLLLPLLYGNRFRTIDLV